MRKVLRSLNRFGAAGLISGAVLSALCLLEPRRLGTANRALYRVAVGAVSAAIASEPVEGPEYTPRAVRGAAALAAFGATIGTAPALEALDARLTDGLVRAGIRHPRVLFAAVAGLVSVASWAIMRRSATAPVWDEDPGDVPEPAPLPDDARALIAHLLGATTGHGSRLLRRHLAAATCVSDDGAFISHLSLEVPEELDSAVPRMYAFPITARFRPVEDGPVYEASLWINEKLNELAVTECDDDGSLPALGWTVDADDDLPRWPRPDEVVLYRATGAGIEPVAGR